MKVHYPANMRLTMAASRGKHYRFLFMYQLSGYFVLKENAISICLPYPHLYGYWV